MTRKRLFIISNRLPVSVSRQRGEIVFRESPGGLATGLRTLPDIVEPVFVGWPGLWPGDEDEKDHIQATLRESHASRPVFLSPREVDKYYFGFTNRTLWPLFHYFPSYCTYEESEWDAFRRVNHTFFQRIDEMGTPGDMFWVHDYHLFLLPALIRKRFPQAAVGFFLHIPFPSSEIFRLLPWRREILEGILGADLIGFHTYEYARHFLSSVLRILGREHEFGMIPVEDRQVKVENFPMGIDFSRIEEKLSSEKARHMVENLLRRSGAGNRRILISIDRMDYSKGIPQRLRGLEYFLERYPNWRKQFVYIMLCQPSRTKVRQYALLKQEVDRMVGSINGRFGTPDWMPIHYMYRSLPFDRILPLYAAADIALVTPLRDGMNLVAKEFVAARSDESGVLILSETAGSAAELGEALQINVNSRTEIAAALAQAFEMSPDEQARRMRLMRQRLSGYDIFHWTRSFVEGMDQVKILQTQRLRKRLDESQRKRLRSEYGKASRRLLLLDYDGTLVPFASRPEGAGPDPELIRLLKAMGSDPGNRVVIISGRDRATLDAWLGKCHCALVAEHGAWVNSRDASGWSSRWSGGEAWKSEIRPILKTFEVRVPGSLLEEKEFGMAWHYRRANPELGTLKSDELYDHLSEFLANTDLQVMRGNKVIEVRPGGINKGDAAQLFLAEREWDFILGVGDDWTDEDMFRVLPEAAWSIKIGFKPTRAHYYVKSPAECREMLGTLSRQ